MCVLSSPLDTGRPGSGVIVVRLLLLLFFEQASLADTKAIRRLNVFKGFYKVVRTKKTWQERGYRECGVGVGFTQALRAEWSYSSPLGTYPQPSLILFDRN